MSWLLWTALGFALGSLPFSVWIGRLALRKDIRSYGDRNPGATNVLRAGGKLWFVAALLLDIAKGAAPVGAAYWLMGIRGMESVPIALAPVLGHAFSPFLGFKGGKAVATMGGIWIGLTLAYMPVVLMLLLIFWFYVVTVSGWAVILTALSGLAYLLINLPDQALIAVMIGCLLLSLYKQREDLAKPLRLRLPKGASKVA
ncbi:MAG: glycerol-3-phosphate acyltransferase [Chloroflexi bacterium CFX4]|nr:glycerol-3-phosphate acyltransferase [Chloroflexi bacterium CFX4]MDL1922659.1 glycerol-3-phosphate acyltransferase [Chloroflexi bacterium CFX3]